MHPTLKDPISEMYVKAYPVSLILELTVQFLSVLAVVSILLFSLYFGNIFIFSAGVVVAFYAYQLLLAFITAFIAFLIPKPQVGPLEKKSEIFKYVVHSSLMMFIRRSAASNIVFLFPFPGYFFYRLWGGAFSPFITINSASAVHDPYLVSIGRGSIIGENALVYGHWVPRENRVRLGRITIGAHVVIGASATIWPDVTIGDGVIVQEKSSVLPGTVIPAREIWGGFPAKKIKDRID